MAEYVVYDAFLGALNIRQVSSSQFQEQVETLVDRQSGLPAVAEIYAVKSDPQISLETRDIAALSTSAILQTGHLVTSGTNVIPWVSRLAGTTFGAGGSAFAITGSHLVAVVERISAAQGQLATATVKVGFHTNGSATNTPPFSISAATTPAAQAFNKAFTLGPVSIEIGDMLEAVLATSVTGITINPGCQLVAVEPTAGFIYPSFQFIETVEPSIDVTFRDLSFLTNLGGPKAITGITAFLRRLDDGGIFDADGAGTHASYSFAGGIASISTIQASGQKSGDTTLRFAGKTLVASITANIAA